MSDTGTDDRLWRGETLGARADVRRRQLMDAAFTLMGDGGASAVTMRAVCRRAGLSPRYFYESFASTDELIVAVYDDCNTQLMSELTEAFVAHADDDDVVRVAVRAASSFFLEDAARVRVLLREPMADAVLGARRSGGAQEIVARLVALGETPGAAGTPVDRDRLEVAASALSGAFTFLILDWIDGRITATQEQLIEHATMLAGSVMRAAVGRGKDHSRHL